MNSKTNSYRANHASEGYGKHYQQTYSSGYYALLWENIEKPITRSILEELNAEGKRSCLDFACGTGRITEVANQCFDSVTGVDISTDMLTVARERLHDVTFIEQDVTSHILDKSFDVITSYRFFLNAEESLRKEVLLALKKMLDDSGILIINVHINKTSILGFIYRARNFLFRRNLANTLGYQEFKELLDQTGFVICDSRWYGYYPRTGWRFNSIATLLMTPVEKLCSSIGIVPKSIAQNFIVICKKSD